MGSVVEDGDEGKIRYNGGSRKCVLVREGMRVEELRGLVQETVGGGGNKRAVSAMIVGGNTSELVEDDDISTVSDDRGDEEVNPNGNV